MLASHSRGRARATQASPTSVEFVSDVEPAPRSSWCFALTRLLEHALPGKPQRWRRARRGPPRLRPDNLPSSSARGVSSAMTSEGAHRSARVTACRVVGLHLRSPCAKRVASAPQPSPPCNCTPSQHAAAAHPLGVRARPRVGATRLDVPPRHFAQAVECAQLRVDLPVRRPASGRRAPMPHTDRCQSRVSSYESPCSLCVFPACA